MSNNIKILIIGSGFISNEYLKVISNYKLDCVVVGRGKENILNLQLKFKGIKFYSGGLEKFLQSNSINKFTHFINLVNIEYVFDTTNLLLDYGAKNILLEKPGAILKDEIKLLEKKSIAKKSKILIAYNRRFYKSINKLIELCEKDGGIQNISFEFTEWVHTIIESDYNSEVLKKWIISNSSHVIDTVFYLAGFPKIINSYVEGKNLIKWHPSGSIFVGSGISEKNISFSYNTNWNSAGRWAIEVSTNKHRFYLKPMEKLFKQKKGEINLSEIDINENNDKYEIEFKPGIHDLILCYLKSDFSKFLNLKDQMIHINLYNKIGGY